MTKKISPSEIEFDIKKGKSAWDHKTPVVSILIATKDEDHDDSDNLGRHNVSDLPKIIGTEHSECSFEVRDGDLDDIKAQMIAAGFTYKKMRNW
jgi:hypothetical protein